MGMVWYKNPGKPHCGNLRLQKVSKKCQVHRRHYMREIYFEYS